MVVGDRGGDTVVVVAQQGGRQAAGQLNRVRAAVRNIVRGFVGEHPKLQPAEGELEAAAASHVDVGGASVGTEPMVFIPRLAALFRPDDLKAGTKHHWATPCFDSNTATVTKGGSDLALKHN